MKLISPCGIKVVVFDTQLAGYILNSTKDTYNFDDIAKDFLSENVLSEEEVLGKGKSRKSVRTLEKMKELITP